MYPNDQEQVLECRDILTHVYVKVNAEQMSDEIAIMRLESVVKTLNQIIERNWVGF